MHAQCAVRQDACCADSRVTGCIAAPCCTDLQVSEGLRVTAQSRLGRPEEPNGDSHGRLGAADGVPIAMPKSCTHTKTPQKASQPSL